MLGHDPQQVPCGFCRKYVLDLSATWSEGVPYHDSCYKISISNELKQYQKKVSLGTITMAESHRCNELESELNLIRDADKRPAINHHHKTTVPSITCGTNAVFFSEERRQEVIKTLKESREQSKLRIAKIEADKLSGENYKNTLISDGKEPNSTALPTPQKTAFFTPPKT